MQQLVEFFNQATTMETGCSHEIDSLDRIKNLVSNVNFSKVNLTDEKNITLTFLTTKKGKTPQCMSYIISRDRLSSEQINNLIDFSQKVKS